MNFIFVYITTTNKEEARKITLHLLKKKLIACGNIFENMTSIYPWKGKIEEASECVLIVKTLKTHFEKVKIEVEKIHSYEIPCITKISVSSNKKYFDWLKSEIK
jgi:periplasmic divalent cation tolerance protein